MSDRVCGLLWGLLFFSVVITLIVSVAVYQVKWLTNRCENRFLAGGEHVERCLGPEK